MDLVTADTLVTAKTLVSATLVFAIVSFSLVSFQALFAQVRSDLRAVRTVPARTKQPRHRDA